MVRVSVPRQRQQDARPSTRRYVVLALFALVVFWTICFVVLTLQWFQIDSGEGRSMTRGHQRNDAAAVETNNNRTPTITKERILEPQNLSRSGKVVASSDVRGNLGPVSVVVQEHPGKDWIHDRWQAASNMHGKNIPGAHWIHLDFGTEIIVDKIVLDWEAAYADKYRLEGSLEPISDETPNDGKKVWTLFDGTDPNQQSSQDIQESGQSPGVKAKTPLHVTHSLHPLQFSQKPLRYLRLYILKSAMGWGVSLWQFDCYGFYASEVTM